MISRINFINFDRYANAIALVYESIICRNYCAINIAKIDKIELRHIHIIAGSVALRPLISNLWERLEKIRRRTQARKCQTNSRIDQQGL